MTGPNEPDPATQAAPAALDATGERRRALRDLLMTSATAGAAAQAVLPIDTGRQGDPFPLLDVQQAYWVGRSADLELGGVACHGYCEVDLPDLDASRLTGACNRLIARHPMLRAIVLPTGQQQILPHVPSFSVPVTDAVGRPGVLDSVREEMSHQMLATDRWPLFDIRVTRLDGRLFRLHLSIDILIADARSFGILAKELLEIYQDPNRELAPVGVSFRDYVLATSGLHADDDYHSHLGYWLERLPSLPPPPALPYSADSSSLRGHQFERLETHLSAQRWAGLRRSAAALSISPAALLLTAFAEAIGYWAAAPAFSLNVTTFDRQPVHPDIDRVVGPFTNLFLVDVDLSSGTFAALASGIQRRLWEALEHREVSGVQVLREWARHGGPSSMPVVFTYVGDDGPDFRAALGRAGQVSYAISQTPQVLIDCQVSHTDDELWLCWDTVPDAFTGAVLPQMFAAFADAVAVLSDGFDAHGAASLVPTSPDLIALRERTEEPAIPQAQCLHEMVLAVKRDDVQPAVVGEDGTVSLDELRRAAARVAHEIGELGVRGGELVAVAVERGWRQTAALLGVLQAGAAYLPIDTTLPPARARQLAELGQVRCVVAEDDRPPWNAWSEITTVRVCAAGPDADSARTAPVTPDDLAYVIYTSGSTGEPKGVRIRHRAAANTLLDINHRYLVSSHDRVLAVSSIGFDLSVWDVFGILGAGGTVICTPPGAAAKDPAIWIELLKRERVTIWNSAPALMSMLVDLAELRRERLDHLRLVLLSGDWIPVGLPDRIRVIAPSARVVSLGGATEASVWSIGYEIGQVDPAWTSIPYGYPLAGQQVLVLDWAGRERPVGVDGELYIGGVGVADGYWNSPDLTAQAFIETRNYGRIYRTGDLARRRDDGALTFLGRCDGQVKVQGHRIEIAEIDAALNRLALVRAAATSVVRAADGHNQLCAQVVPTGRITAEEIRGELAARLPSYMVPTHLIIVGELPVTANGKLDRSVSQLPPGDAAEPAEPTARASGPILLRMRDMVSRYCGAPVDPYEDLLVAGLDSVDLVRLGGQLEEAWGLRPALDDVLQHPTLAEIDLTLQQQIVDRLDAGQRLTDGGEDDADARMLVDPADREAFRLSLEANLAWADRAAGRRPLPADRRNGTSAAGNMSCASARVTTAQVEQMCGTLARHDPNHRRIAPGSPHQVHVLLAGADVPDLAGLHMIDAKAAELVLLDPQYHLPVAGFDTFPAADFDAASTAFAFLFVVSLPAYEALYGARGTRVAAVEVGAMVQALITEAPPDLALQPVPFAQSRAFQLDRWLGPGEELMYVLLGSSAAHATPPEGAFEEGLV
jgi:amino acid adenylation domain-containing protein